MRFSRGHRERAPVIHLRAGNGDFDPDNPVVQGNFNRALQDVLRGLDGFRPRGPALLKVHVGERSCRTNLRPVFLASSVSWLLESGVRRVAVGDTTVLYSGPRGDRQNGPDAAPYRKLARKKRFGLLAPFVVLDRPVTARGGPLAFEQEEHERTTEFGGRFKRFYPAGGFAASGTVLHHAHLTLHTVAHLALCVKGLSMGLSGRRGKLAMHQCYHPHFDDHLCAGCDLCVDSCPEQALQGTEEGPPRVSADACIGCAECMAICPEGAVRMQGEEVTDWGRGEQSLPFRMVDYLLGLMDGRWEDVIHIAHMYDITRLCDCVDETQKPICGHLGFLVGRNPLAVDLAARRLLEEELGATTGGRGIRSLYPQDAGSAMFDYARTTYGMLTEPELLTHNVEVTR